MMTDDQLLHRIIELRDVERRSWREIAQEMPYSHMTCKNWYEWGKVPAIGRPKQPPKPKQPRPKRVRVKKKAPHRVLISPDGQRHEIQHVETFAALHGLRWNRIYDLFSGERASHRGWKVASE